jgi:hypothetical protein
LQAASLGLVASWRKSWKVTIPRKAQFFHAAIAYNAIVTQSVSCDLIDERQNHRIERYIETNCIAYKI